MKSPLFIVSVDDVDGHAVACATLREAMKLRAGLEYPDGEVMRVYLAQIPGRRLLAALFNHEGYAAVSEVIMPAKEKGE